jgi:PAS domain S-box-containing protein
VIWIFTTARVLRKDGKALGMMGATLEITEHKESQEASAHLAAIVESSEDAIISKDIDGTIRSWNHCAELIYGYSAAEAIGRSVIMLIPPELQLEEKRILETIREGRRIETFESVRIRKDGSRIDVSITVSPVKDANGRIVGASNISRDITRQKKAEQELERAHKEVVAASRAKDDFLAALSHELRTPLNPVLLLASEAANDPELPAALREQFNLISKNISLEARLIDDLLDLTRITRGKLPIEAAPVDVHSVLQDALVAAGPEIQQKEIVLTVALDADRHTVFGDSVRLQQVFWNVVKNAVKFTSAGGSMTITTGTVPGEDELLIEVTDSGIGLTAEEASRIFEPFMQGEHAGKGGSHRFGGLGLGLAISRKLVELHSGRISAQSAGRGQGATFSIHLPLTAANVEASPQNRRPAVVPGKAHSPNGIRILLVEDHEPTRTALAQLLTRRHYTVVSAATVGEARAHAAKEDFHLLLSDIGLPDGNGLELMAELRQRRGLKGIALTGYGMEEDLARTQNAGFGAHLIKPVRAQSLDTALASVLGS